MSKRLLLPYCGILLALVAVSCDMIAPVFYDIERDLGGGIERVQGVIPVFLLMAAVGQLVFGPASDRFGRKPVLIAGLCLYIVGSVLAGFATSIAIMYGARMIQGLGAACGAVLARAVLRDSYSGEELGRSMALSGAIFAVGPLVAPLIGALIVNVSSWRGTFVAMTLFGAALLSIAVMLMRETNRAPNPRALEPQALLAAARAVVQHRQSRHFMAVQSLLQLMIVLMIASAPRVFQLSFGLEGMGFARLVAFAACGMALGQLVSNRAIKRLGMITTVRIAALVMCGTTAAIYLLASSGKETPTGFILLLFAFNASFPVVMANAVSLVLDPHRTIAGVASSILGAATQLFGAVMTLAILPRLDGTMVSWSRVHLVLAILVTVLVWLYRPQLRFASSPAQPH